MASIFSRIRGGIRRLVDIVIPGRRPRRTRLDEELSEISDLKTVAPDKPDRDEWAAVNELKQVPADHPQKRRFPLADNKRKSRYLYLRKRGFLPVESDILSKIPFDVPYISNIIKDRMDLYKKCIDRNMTRGEYLNYIKQLYIDKGYIKPGKGVIRANIDVWAMLRGYEDLYKQKNPEYDSPYKKKRTNWNDFMTKAEKTIERLERKWAS